MSHRALYRQYRPAAFSEMIGQEHITTILKNQVKSGTTAHAYLFAGTRGTGKTSAARILARAVNCEEPMDGEPCGCCRSCKISAGECADIIELDAASNTGVDDMRDIIEKARFMPLELKHKVYIIDEAHALSANAFNALLKTLEEPPPHVTFILATTEPHKIPATIISRCQRMDFHRLGVSDMVRRTEEVLERENAHIERDGLMAIARAAEGGMRDCLSLADQCLSFCGNNVSTQDVYSVLGSMEDGFLFDMAEAVLSSDPARALELLDQVVRDGRDLKVFLHDLTQHMRSLLLTKLCGHCSDTGLHRGLYEAVRGAGKGSRRNAAFKMQRAAVAGRGQASDSYNAEGAYRKHACAHIPARGKAHHGRPYGAHRGSRAAGTGRGAPAHSNCRADTYRGKA